MPINTETHQLLQRIKQLQQCQHQSQTQTQTLAPPIGFTPARFTLALQSFHSRFAYRRRRECLIDPDATIDDFVIPFGPEWELKGAMLELDELLNKE